VFQLLEEPDFEAITDFAKSYIDFVKSEKFHEDNAFEHRAFEILMEACYGDDIFEKLQKVMPEEWES